MVLEGTEELNILSLSLLSLLFQEYYSLYFWNCCCCFFVNDVAGAGAVDFVNFVGIAILFCWSMKLAFCGTFCIITLVDVMINTSFSISTRVVIVRIRFTFLLIIVVFVGIIDIGSLYIHIKTIVGGYKANGPITREFK